MTYLLSHVSMGYAIALYFRSSLAWERSLSAAPVRSCNAYLDVLRLEDNLEHVLGSGYHELPRC